MAGCVALGCIVGITPTLPFHTIQLIVLAKIFRVNFLVATIVAAVISNPLTFPFQYYSCWFVGRQILDNSSSWEQIHFIIEPGLSWVEKFELMEQIGKEAMCATLTGGYILALLLGSSAFVATYFFVRKH